MLEMDSHIAPEDACICHFDVEEHPVVVGAVCRQDWPPTGGVTDTRKGEWYERLVSHVGVVPLS
jgi:hypothetical protein